MRRSQSFFFCHITLAANTTDIHGTYTLEPSATDPSTFDVRQEGGVTVQFEGFHSATTCNLGLLDILIEDFITILINSAQADVALALETFLNNVDTDGNTPIARAIEEALAELSIASIAQNVSERFGMMMDAVLFQVAEDDTGLTLGADFFLTSEAGTAPDQCLPPAGTAMLSASYHVEEPFPELTAVTPQGGEPYDLGVAISTSGFNQYLKALIECGFFVTRLEELDFNSDGEVVPINAERLGLLIPAFQDLPPETPLVITTRPTLAPLMTGNPSPFGELVELFIGQFTGEIRDVSNNDASLLDFAFDFRAGLDVEFDSSASEGGLRLIPRGGDSSDVTVAILDNPIQADEAFLQVVLPDTLFSLLPGLGNRLNAFPLPEFEGLRFEVVEISRDVGFISLFVNLVPSAE